MKKKIAVIILNRNLPLITNKLVNNINKKNSIDKDIYVVEAGSDKKKLSKYCTWHIKDDSTKKNGLRYPRGMNCGLSNLYFENKIQDYDYFLLLTNDTEFKGKNYLNKLVKIMETNKKIGILSPCSKDWGEKKILKKSNLKFFWYIHNTAYFIRGRLIQELSNFKKNNYKFGLFDGSNFRGYGTDSELIAKSYANGYACAITSKVWAEENNSYLLSQSDLIKTDNYNKNLQLWTKEGFNWMQKKYGFKNKWDLNFYVKSFYDRFFDHNKYLLKYKI